MKKQVQDWLNNISSKRNAEWLIVQASTQESSKRFLNVRGTVFDKIKADFTIGKKER